jgi:hypothetical protein
MNVIAIDKLIVAKFVCSACVNTVYIKADIRGEFPSYIQCNHCEQYFEIFTQTSSLRMHIHPMDKGRVDWLLTIEERSKNDLRPLTIYRTKSQLDQETDPSAFALFEQLFDRLMKNIYAPANANACAEKSLIRHSLLEAFKLGKKTT